VRALAPWLLILASGCAGAVRPEVSLAGSAGYGPVQGFSQIPQGGAAGTTSSQQPTLKQLGIEDAEIYGVEGRLGLSGEAVFVGYSTVPMSGDTTLDQSFTSQGSIFEEGSHVHASEQLTFFRAGYEHAFPLADRTTVLAPEVGFALLNVSSAIDGSEGGFVSRSFSRATVLLGARLEVNPMELLGFEARFQLTPDLPDVPLIYSLEGKVKLHVLGHLDVFLGLGFERWEYVDTERPLHNDVRMILGPIGLGGLEARF
jgi:hypothetical protein